MKADRLLYGMSPVWGPEEAGNLKRSMDPVLIIEIFLDFIEAFVGKCLLLNMNSTLILEKLLKENVLFSRILS